MKKLIFRNADSTLRVEYQTSLLNASDENFTVMQISGLSDAEILFGLQFKQLDYKMSTFKQFAIDNDLTLEMQTQDSLVALVDGSVDLTISTTSPLPDGSQTTPYTTTLVGVGNDGTKVWSIESGSLPDGLSLDSSTGIISGTPTTAEVQVFVVKLADDFTSVTKSLSLTITA